MEERHWDDSARLSDKKTIEDMRKAMHDPNNKSVALHKPGSIVKMSDGTEYEVQQDGSWKKLK